MKKLTPKQYASILDQTVKSAQDTQKATEVFLQMLDEHYKTHKLSEILSEFEQLQKGNKVIKVTTSFDLTQEIQTAIKTIFGQTSQIEHKKDQNIKGGIVIQTENHLFDASIQNQLDALKIKMLNSQ